MIHTFKINIPTIQEIIDLKYPIRAFFWNKYLKLDTWAFKTFSTKFWRIMHRVSGRCGSLMAGHSPVFHNTKSWLWIPYPDGFFCTVCHEIVLVKEGHGTYKNFYRMSREDDVTELKRLRTTATNDTERLAIDKSLHNINHESPEIRSMRESLIKANREGDIKEAKEINEYVMEHSKYRKEVK